MLLPFIQIYLFIYLILFLFFLLIISHNFSSLSLLSPLSSILYSPPSSFFYISLYISFLSFYIFLSFFHPSFISLIFFSFPNFSSFPNIFRPTISSHPYPFAFSHSSYSFHHNYHLLIYLPASYFIKSFFKLFFLFLIR